MGKGRNKNKIRHRGDHLRFAGIILFNLVALCIVLFPFYWLITASLKPDKYIITRTFYPYPPEVTFDHFVTVFTFGNLLQIFMNSVKVSLLTVIFSLIAIVPAAYALGVLKPKGSRFISRFILSLQMLPGILLVILLPYARLILFGPAKGALRKREDGWMQFVPGAAEDSPSADAAGDDDDGFVFIPAGME